MHVGTKSIDVSLPEALKEYANKRVGEGPRMAP